MSSAPDLLEAAGKHMRDRASTYDKPGGERSMTATVAAFNIITGRTGDRALTESEAWLILQTLKDVRDRSRVAPHRDSLEDCIAYSALKAEARLLESEQVTLQEVMHPVDTWIDHYGGDCPVPPGTPLMVRFRSGQCVEVLRGIGNVGWHHRGIPYDIVSLKIPK